ncbi:methyl-CpG-binding domain-containing protein 2-like isoform X2 [Cynara cardunculus var. scolymus]|nr:methyl-CpG-binding domain-containing protein 2-like isoform X2 [Cynara cardunculus var. scolymus]XP_024960609.1 methyl-CpG-binding domain-containing protein 2-like isoform X2 [Cynara cardunculus var. scolymus]
MGGKVHEIKASTVQGHQESVEKDHSVLDGPKVPSNGDSKGTDQNIVDVSSSDYSTEEDVRTPSYDDSRKQMVLYDPSVNGSEAIEAVQNPERGSVSRQVFDNRKVVPEVGAFTVQCANCFKWRLIPDQERYEVIREHITDQPFTCETTREWDREISCDEPTDLEQDGTRIWAIDKPNIAQPPPGWKRLLRLRSEGSSKFADVYYTSPTGTKLRSIPDVQRYLDNHPEQKQVADVRRFSFQIPRPLRENYVRKRPTQMPGPGTPGSLGPSAVEPIAWAGPEENLDLQLAEPLAWAGPAEERNGMPYMKTPELDPVNREVKGAAKKAKKFLDCL